jgi:hypothetical protein
MVNSKQQEQAANGAEDGEKRQYPHLHVFFHFKEYFHKYKFYCGYWKCISFSGGFSETRKSLLKI